MLTKLKDPVFLRRIRRGLVTVALSLGAILGTLLVGLGIAYLGIWLGGSVDAFSAFADKAAPFLLVWRLGLYTVVTHLWLTLYRPRLMEFVSRDDDGGQEAMTILRRVEWGFIIVVTLLEIHNLNQWWSS